MIIHWKMRLSLDKMLIRQRRWGPCPAARQRNRSIRIGRRLIHVHAGMFVPSDRSSTIIPFLQSLDIRCMDTHHQQKYHVNFAVHTPIGQCLYRRKKFLTAAVYPSAALGEGAQNERHPISCAPSSPSAQQSASRAWHSHTILM